MGFFKDLLFEKEEELNYENPEAILDALKPEVDVNTEGVSTDNVISDLYASNKLNDFTKSIFKVEELINSLPKEMATKTKRDTVLAILTSFGLTTENVIFDGTERMNLLNNSLCELLDQNNSEINNCKVTVESHKESIADLEKRIASLEEDNKQFNEKIIEEVTRINNLINFVEGR